MILCIDTKVLKTSPDVQKDVRLEELLLNHTKYYDTVADAVKDDFAPLDFCVSVRSMFSNLVLESDKTEVGFKKRYYTNLSEVQPFIHKGYDLIMYLTSIGIMMNVDYALGFDEVMTKHSQFEPIGLYCPDPLVIRPMVYSHVILSDEGAKEFEKYLKRGRKLVAIKDMKREGNISALLDTLIEVKEENQDE